MVYPIEAPKSTSFGQWCILATRMGIPRADPKAFLDTKMPQPTATSLPIIRNEHYGMVTGFHEESLPLSEALSGPPILGEWTIAINKPLPAAQPEVKLFIALGPLPDIRPGLGQVPGLLAEAGA